jgi:hypothetical protein
MDLRIGFLLLPRHRNTGLYNRVVWKLAFIALGTLAWAQPAAHWPPRFEDYPVTEKWSGPSAPLKLTSRSGRMYRTRLTTASKEAPNFAGRYRFAIWGCGSNCAAGAVVDLPTGAVYPPPSSNDIAGERHWIVCAAIDQSPFFRLDSALVIVQCGMGRAVRHYLVWETGSFRRLTPSSK